MRAIHYLHWGRSINLLLKKENRFYYIKYGQNEITLATPSPSPSFCSTAINSQLSRGSHSLRNARARSPRNASEGSVIRFRTLNLQASARVPVDSAGHHLVFIPDSYASSIVSPCFSRSYLVVDVSGRSNFRIITGRNIHHQEWFYKPV